MICIHYRARDLFAGFVEMGDTVPVGVNQILRCDNDPSRPERGRAGRRRAGRPMTASPNRVRPAPAARSHFPQSVCNPPGLRAIATASATTWRSATRCCGRLPGETPARPAGSPAPRAISRVQMVEWWAYLADILTFYNERIANEAYLAHRRSCRRA